MYTTLVIIILELTFFIAQQWKSVYAVAKHGNAVKPGGLYIYKDDKVKHDGELLFIQIVNIYCLYSSFQVISIPMT